MYMYMYKYMYVYVYNNTLYGYIYMFILWVLYEVTSHNMYICTVCLQTPPITPYHRPPTNRRLAQCTVVQSSSGSVVGVTRVVLHSKISAGRLADAHA